MEITQSAVELCDRQLFSYYEGTYNYSFIIYHLCYKLTVYLRILLIIIYLSFPTMMEGSSIKVSFTTAGGSIDEYSTVVNRKERVPAVYKV